MSYELCSDCNTTGKIDGHECSVCHGKGWVFWEPEIETESEDMRAFGDHLQDWI